MRIFGKKTGRAGRAESGYPPEMNTEEIRSQKKAAALSRRQVLRYGLLGTAVVAERAVELGVQHKKQVGQFVEQKAAEAIYNYAASHQDVPLSAEDAAPTLISPTDPTTVVFEGTSLTAGTETRDGKTLAARVGPRISRRVGRLINTVSGAVPGALPSQMGQQYETIKHDIPPGDQHHVIQGDDNAANAVPHAVENLAKLARNPVQPGRIMSYLSQRGQIADDLENSLVQAAEQIADGGGRAVRSIKMVGPAPTHKANDIQELTDGTTPLYIPVEGDSTTRLLTQAVLMDYETQGMRATQRAASRVRKSRPGVQTTLSDIRRVIKHDNYNGTQHYNEKGADDVATTIADGYDLDKGPR